MPTGAVVVEAACCVEFTSGEADGVGVSGTRLGERYRVAIGVVVDRGDPPLVRPLR